MRLRTPAPPGCAPPSARPRRGVRGPGADATPRAPKLPWPTTTGLRRPSRIAPPTHSGSSSSRRRPTAPRISSPPADDTGPERIALRMASRTVADVPSMTFSATLPVKPSATMTSSRPPVRSKPSTLPAKSRLPPVEPLARLQHHRRPLAALLAHRQQAHPRARNAVDRLHEGRAHVGELHQVLGPGLDAGAGVQEQHGPARAPARARPAPGGARRASA